MIIEISSSSNYAKKWITAFQNYKYISPSISVQIKAFPRKVCIMNSSQYVLSWEHLIFLVYKLSWFSETRTHFILVRVQLLPSISRPYWYCVFIIKSIRSCNCWVMYTAECKIFLQREQANLDIRKDIPSTI